MTKQIKVGDVVEVVETSGHWAKKGSIGVVGEVFEDGSFWSKIFEEGWGSTYGQTMRPSNVKLLTREGELKEVSGNTFPRHHFPIGTTVEVVGVGDYVTYEDFMDEGMAVVAKLPASEDSYVQYVNVYDLSEVDTIKEGSEDKAETLRNLDEDTLILYTDESDNIRLATFVAIDEDGMFTVDTQPADMWDGLKTIPNHRFEDSLGFSIGDTVMYTGKSSFYHQLEEGDVMTVVELDSDGDLVLDTSKLEHVTQSEQYLFDEQCLDLSLVDKTSLDGGSVSEFKVGDTVRITDTSCLSSLVKVGDIAEVERLGQMFKVRLTSGVAEGQRQYVDDYQIELVTEEEDKTKEKGDDNMTKIKVGDIVRITDTSGLNHKVKVGDTAEVESLGRFIMVRMIDGVIKGRLQATDDFQLELILEKDKTNEKGDDSMYEVKVGDIVRITDTKCLHSKVKVGDIAKVEELGQYSITVRMVSGDIEGQRQYVSDYQLELVDAGSPKKVLFKKGTQFRNEEDVDEVYGLYKDFKEGDTVALIAQYDKFSFDTDIAEIIEVTDLGSEECVFQPYGNIFSDVEKVIVTESFTAGRRVFEKGDIYTVEVLTADDEGVFTETVIIFPSGGRFTVQGVRDYSEFFAEYTGEEREKVKETEGLRPFQVGDTVRIKDDSIFHQEVSVGDIGVVDGVSESIVGFKVTEGDGVGHHQVVVRGNERHHKYLELVEKYAPVKASTFSESSSEDKVSTAKKTDFKKGDVVKVTDSHYYSQSVSVGDVAKVDGVDSDGDLILKFIGEGSLDGLTQYTDGDDIELLVRTTEDSPKFEVGDIVSIKDDYIFNDKVAVGDKAVITSDGYVLLMLTGKHKGQQQTCFSHNEDYANKYLELVRK